MRSLFRPLVLAATAAVLATGCASAGAPGSGARHNVVTGPDLMRVGDVSLYEALRQVRPAFLRARGATGTTIESQPLQVYIGGLRMESVDHLREIQVRTVKEVQYLEPAQANTRFGGNNSGGALVVTLL